MPFISSMRYDEEIIINGDITISFVKIGDSKKMVIDCSKSKYKLEKRKIWQSTNAPTKKV